MAPHPMNPKIAHDCVVLDLAGGCSWYVGAPPTGGSDRPSSEINGVFLWPFILLGFVILGIWNYCERKKTNSQRKTHAEREVSRAAQFRETTTARGEVQASIEGKSARWAYEKEALRREEVVPLLIGDKAEMEQKRGL